MNIKIKKNDYVQPTEIRENIVQGICDVLLEYVDRSLPLTVYVKSAVLFIGTRKSDGTKVISHSQLNTDTDYIRINSCEMNASFQALQDAGYFIYLERDKKTKTSTYRFSKKPVLWGVPAKTIEFDMFID